MPTSSLLHSTKKPAGLGKMTLRDLLLLGGAGRFTADMSIPYMNMLPGTCEPYAQGVIQIVKGLQRLLNARGAALDVDGGLGAEVQKWVVKFSGPRWYEKTWAQIYLDVIDGSRWQGAARPTAGMPGFDVELDAATNQYMQGMGDDWAAPRPRSMQTREPTWNWVDPVRPPSVFNPRPKYAQERGPTYPNWVDPVPPPRPQLPRPKMAMGSYFHGLGSDQSAYLLRSGVAIPLTAAELALFQSIQRQVNAINAKQGRSLVAVDGRIGSQTIDALSTIVWKNSSDPWANVKVTPQYVADNAAGISSELSSLMGTIGASYVADPVTSSKPSTVKTDGTIDNPPDSTDTTKLVIAAVVIGGAVAFLGKKKRKRR